VQVLDLKDEKATAAARGLGIRSVPAVVITASKLAPCCSSGPGPDDAVLREAGIGRPVQIEGRRRRVEIFSAGCSMCREVVELVQRMACHSCDVQILDMNDDNVARFAKSLGVRSVPAIVITASELAPCCAGKRGPDEAVLRQAGIGLPITG
jgi:hypothetical protein